ncbi:hypothetical protein J437_LFUL004745 [Ladona fulva]|uniref:Uncharacterized protein n=1 Tax=Ladona fulva TaxID=123851 RepID=A0A8K0K5W1_LADFU|nr:hypothetical protein J437_LFUL004745 [Ladona fulva]
MENLEDLNECNEDNIGPRIEKWEVEKAMKDLKSGKALGYDKIPSEALKNLGREALDRVTNLINNIYETAGGSHL